VDAAAKKSQLKTWPVYLINLAHRSDRLHETLATLERCGWCDLFRWPEVVQAVNGWKLPVPAAYGHGMAGAFGCKASHERILERSILDETPGVIVLEDDFEVLEGRAFVEECGRFLDSVPDDFDQLMLGYQGWGKPVEPVNNHVVRILGSNRTHFYAVRDRPGFEMRRELYRHWTSTDGHCDHLMSEIQPGYRVYGPTIQVCGQRKSFSDITGRDEDSRHFIVGGDRRPILVLHTSPGVVAALEEGKLIHVHRPVDLAATRLRPELVRLQKESWALGCVTALVHPDLTTAVVRLATGDPVFSVCGSTISEVMDRLPIEIKTALGMTDAA
jgi:hypothetical protein